MKYYIISLSILLIIIINSCEEDTQLSFSYDCFKKTTYYSSSDEIVSWHTFYYLNDRNVKREYPSGDIWELKYEAIV